MVSFGLGKKKKDVFFLSCHECGTKEKFCLFFFILNWILFCNCVFLFVCLFVNFHLFLFTFVCFCSYLFLSFFLCSSYNKKTQTSL